MKTIGIIYCPQNLSETVLIRDLHKFIPIKLKKNFLKNLPPASYHLEFKDIGIEIFGIQFPSTVEGVCLLSDKNVLNFCRQIRRMLHKNNISNLVIDKNLEKIRIVKNYFSSLDGIHFFDGRRLFVLYLEEILNIISKLLKTELNCFKIGIIADNGLNAEEVSVVKGLAKKIRFLCIISLNYKNFVQLGEEIYEETGLLVRLGKNIKNAIEDCDIIINFSNEPQFINSFKFSTNLVIINCGSGLDSKNLRGVVINGLEMYCSKPPLKTYSWANHLSFCEALVYSKDEVEDNDVRGNQNIVRNYIADLKKLGYRISGFVGYNGKLNLLEFRALGR